MMMPSIKIRGFELTFGKLLSPLNNISSDWPGCPPEELVFTPATFPVNADDNEVAGTLLNCSPETFVTETVMFFFEVAPATPVTITSERFAAEDSFKTMFNVEEEPTLTSEAT